MCSGSANFGPPSSMFSPSGLGAFGGSLDESGDSPYVGEHVSRLEFSDSFATDPEDSVGQESGADASLERAYGVAQQQQQQRPGIGNLPRALSSSSVHSSTSLSGIRGSGSSSSGRLPALSSTLGTPKAPLGAKLPSLR